MADGFGPLDGGRTASAHAVIVVPGEAAEVFAYVADVSRHPLWSPKPLRISDLPPDGALEVGSSFTSHGVIPGDKEHRNEVVVTELRPPRRLVLRSTDGSGTYVNTFVVEPVGEGTVSVTRELTMPRPGGLLGVTTPLFVRLVLRRELRAGMAKLAGLLRSAA